ncbi:hypothetical protein DFH05DRAFT_1471887 [Lentinula detonsa]|uniref:Uncharacterized protein n=1 Tax=Lentinula detonsa TaxID=2804962 RepID=A0A9W8PCW5_9AGAR|nr:hypothetical protein DFH05DRAFT_1471887 [Lentinula detonsa]
MRSVLAYFTLALCSAVLAVPTLVTTSSVSPATVTGAANLNASPSINTADSVIVVNVEFDELWRGRRLSKPTDRISVNRVPLKVRRAVRLVVEDFVRQGRSRMGTRQSSTRAATWIQPKPQVKGAKIRILYTHAYKSSKSFHTSIGFWGPSLNECLSNTKGFRCNVMIKTGKEPVQYRIEPCLVKTSRL